MAAKVKLDVPSAPMYVGSYAYVRVRIPAASGLAIEDLDFTVPAGPAGGQVSLSRDSDYDARRPTVMLLAGYAPGTYALVATERATGTVVAGAKFAVTTDWNDSDLGPGQVYSGAVMESNVGLAAGGGPIGPQSINIFPAPPQWRLAILFVDTATQRYPGPADPVTFDMIERQWREEVIDGFTVNGETFSTARYYSEVSYGNLTLTGRTYGPVALPGVWDDYFLLNQALPVARLYLSKPELVFQQACITAADGIIDYDLVDTVIIVVRSIDNVMPPQTIRGHATLGRRMFVTSKGQRPLATIVMPHDEGTWRQTVVPWHLGNDQICSVVAHEFGHNLGLGDLYSPAITDPQVAGRTRNPWGWDIMNVSIGLPHLSLAHRMMLGWIPDTWVTAVNHPPRSDPVTLSPIELGQPPGGSQIGAEIRLAEGWNYYLEYRVGQTTQIGDALLRPPNVFPPDVQSCVLGTDVLDPNRYQEWPDRRPYLLTIPIDANNRGPALLANHNYVDPQYPDLKVRLTTVSATAAQVRIEYGLMSQPDPSIRPWPAGPTRPWQSPDIEVKNAINMNRPDRFNLPWMDHDNTVIARVTNEGDLDATQVKVDFYQRRYNAGGMQNEILLGSDVRNVPSGGAPVEFTTTWRPTPLPDEWHYCIVVRIPFLSFTTALGQTVRETTGLNNVAQSNYADFLSGSMSPPSREICNFWVGNPFPVRTRLTLQVRQTNPLYRTYLASRNLTLDPGETRRVRAMFEYMIDPDRPDPRLAGLIGERGGQPNHVALYSLIEDRRDPNVHTDKLLGGAQVRVRTGRVTRFDRFTYQANTAEGKVVQAKDGKPVSGGDVVVTVRYYGKRPEQYAFATLKHGEFSVVLPIDGKCRWIEAEYLPVPGLGECRSPRIPCDDKKKSPAKN